MGVFDGILGGDAEREKDEMRENIDKIRERVQEGGGPGRRADRDDAPQPPVRPEEIPGGKGRGEEPGGPEEETPPERGASFEEELEDEVTAGRPPHERQSRRGPEPENQGPTHEDVPEPPELKDLDVPDIEKGPLFITVDKFRDALHAISDMRRVARDMEDYIGSMEGTLQEDRDTEEGIRQILDEAEGDTEELKDIVSP